MTLPLIFSFSDIYNDPINDPSLDELVYDNPYEVLW